MINMLTSKRALVVLVVVVVFLLQVPVSFAEEEDAEVVDWEEVFDEIPENATEPGYLFVQPSIAFVGSEEKIGVYYILHEHFTDGSVVFHLPEGISATPNRDRILITDRNGDTEGENAKTFLLESSHIANNGHDVYLTGITMDEYGVVALLLDEKVLPDTDYLYFEVTGDADGDGEEKVPPPEILIPGAFISLKGFTDLSVLAGSPETVKTGTTETFTFTYTLDDDVYDGWVAFYLPEEIPVVPGQDTVALNDTERVLTEADIVGVEYDELCLRITGVTARKGDTVTLTLYDKTIPDVGVYLVWVILGVGDEDDSTYEWIDSDHCVFFAYSDVGDGWEIIESFAKTVSDGDLDAAKALVGDGAQYAEGSEGQSVEPYPMEFVFEWLVLERQHVGSVKLEVKGFGRKGGREFHSKRDTVLPYGDMANGCVLVKDRHCVQERK